MATPAQVLANRDNAQHSTGPQTAAGKAASSQNAHRHSLTARGLIIPLGMEAAFAAMESALRANLTPRGGLEDLIFERILECAWNLERCRRAQAHLFDKTAADFSLDPFLDDQNEAKFARFDKYARQFESSLFKSMRELSRLQTEAQYRHEIHPLTQEEVDDPQLFDQTPQSLSAVCDFSKVQAAAEAVKARSKQQGFQNKANADRAAMDFLERFTAPPARRELATAMASDPKAEAA